MILAGISVDGLSIREPNICNLLCFTIFTRAHGSDARLLASLPVSFPFELRATVTMAVLRICALLLLFDCQEAFHCCLVVACINRINMISIECHRSGERCPGKREFDNRIEINRVRSGEIDVAIPFKIEFVLIERKQSCRFRHNSIICQKDMKGFSYVDTVPRSKVMQS